MTKPKPKDQPPSEAQDNQALPPLDYYHHPDGSLVVILASGQKVRFEAGHIPPEFQDLPRP